VLRRVKAGEISIHAPRAGSDLPGHGTTLYTEDFNPRSPCGERLYGASIPAPEASFQSTLPVRGATSSIRSIAVGYMRFQSTLPVRGATTTYLPRVTATSDFNPRSPCGERLDLVHFCPPNMYFNPRSPCGERQGLTSTVGDWQIFQSTLPVRGATRQTEMPQRRSPISIHAPRAGSDNKIRLDTGRTALFQSTLPVRGATSWTPEAYADGWISIHAPRAGSDTQADIDREMSKHISIHAPRAGSDLFLTSKGPIPRLFQSTLPVRGATTIVM